MATATTAIGSIQFEIPRQSLAAGETAEFDCLIAPQQKIYGAGLYVYVAGVAGYQIFQAQGEIGAGASGRIRVPVTLDAARLAEMTGRGGAMTASFHLYINAGLTNSLASPAVDLGMTALKSRLAPQIGTVVFSDATGAKAHFGSFIQGKSQLGVSAPVTTDPLADDVGVASRVLTLNGQAFDLNEGTSLGAPAAAGTLAWSLTVVDSEGLTDTAAGTMNCLAYSPPEISSLSAERYRAVIGDDGTTSYAAASDGEHVRFTLEGAVCPVASANAWTLKVAHNGATATAYSGSDGQEISLENDRSIVSSVVPANERRTFTFTLEDFFESVSAIVSVEKAGAYFNIEPYGVGVGMRAQGTEDDPAMDVAWPIRARGGIQGVTIYSTDEQPTGGIWIDGRPVYRKTISLGAMPAGQTKEFSIGIPSGALGDVVSICGMVQPAGGDYWLPLPHVDTGSIGTWGIKIEIANIKADAKISVGMGSSRACERGFVTIEYTKNTD